MNLKLAFGFLFALCFMLNSYAQIWWNNVYSSKGLNGDRISIDIDNVGGLDWYNNIDGGAFLHNDSSDHLIVYDNGLWVVGKIGNQIHLALKQWRLSYSPGPIINYNAAMNICPEDSVKYRVYKIDINDTLNPGQDYIEWPKIYGAPVDEIGNPIVYNDQCVWTVYNALDSSLDSRKNWNSYTDTLPVFAIEVQSLVYSSNLEQPEWMKDVVFFEWKVISKETEIIDSVFFGLWTDIDFNNANANYPAVDTLINLGYCWSNDDTGGYNHIPIAVGYVFNYGPITNSFGDTAIFEGNKRVNYRNLNLTSFHGIGDDSSIKPLIRPARSIIDAWNIARGYDAVGNEIIDPTTGFTTKFPFSGDPVTFNGFIYDKYNYGVGGGAGFVMFTGPVTLAPQDTQWIMAALLVSTGNDYRDAIIGLRNKASILQSMSYDQLVKKNSFASKPLYLSTNYYLSQNFPNPFNNQTKIRFELPLNTKTTITIYDILGNKVSSLIDEELPAGKHDINFSGNNLSSGVYFYQMIASSFLQTKKMILLR